MRSGVTSLLGWALLGVSAVPVVPRVAEASPPIEVDEAEVVEAPESDAFEVDEAAVVEAAPPVEVDEAEVVAAPEPDPFEVDEAEVVAAPEPNEFEVDEAEVVAAPAPVETTSETTAVDAADEDSPEVEPESTDPSIETAQPTEIDNPHRRRWRKFIRHFDPHGFVQVDFLWRQISIDELSDGDREPLNETGFLLRNARLGFDADWRYFGITAYADLFSNGQGVRPATVDAHLHYPGKDGKPPLVQLRAGLLRVPFGFENHNQNDVQRFFGERTLVSHAFMPGLFDVGAALSGHVWAFDWSIGVYNGQPMGAPGFGYRDPNAAKDYVGRLRLSGLLFPNFHAAVGTSLLTGKGFSAGTGPTKDSFVWVDLNEDGRVTLAELLPVPGAAGRPSENFQRWGVGADLQLRTYLPRIGEMMVYGEFLLGNNLDRAVAVADPVGLGRDQRGIGWYVGLSQSLTRYAMIGLRYDDYRPNLDALELFDGTQVITRSRFQTIATAAAARVYAGQFMRARVLLEYEHQRNTLGRDASGRPAQLPNDTLRARLEVAF